MKRGFSLIELMIVVAIVAIFAATIIPIFARKAGCGSDKPGPDEPVVAKQSNAKTELPGELKIICLDGHEYYYSEKTRKRYTRAVMAPKFDSEGKPSPCSVETAKPSQPQNKVR